MIFDLEIENVEGLRAAYLYDLTHPDQPESEGEGVDLSGMFAHYEK